MTVNGLYLKVESVGGSRNVHFLALSVSKGARPVIRPIFLETKIAVIQTIDYIKTTRLAWEFFLPLVGSTGGGGALSILALQGRTSSSSSPCPTHSTC